MTSLICVPKGEKKAKLIEIETQMVVLRAGRWGNKIFVKKYKLPVKR